MQENALAALCNIASHRPVDLLPDGTLAGDDSDYEDEFDEDELTGSAIEDFYKSMRNAGGVLCGLHALRRYPHSEQIATHALTLLKYLALDETPGTL